MSINGPTSGPATDPSDLIGLRDGIYADDLVIAAVSWLDFFTWLSENPSDSENICRSLDLAPRPLDVMLTLLASMGLVRNDGGVYRTTELAREHLVKGSPWDLGPFYSSQKDRPPCRDLLRVMKTGRPAGWSGRLEGEEWEALMKDERFADDFTSAMDSRGSYLAPAMASRLPCSGAGSLLDIAGGSGIYACAVVERNGSMRATVLEKPPVDRAAEQSIARRGMADRVSVIGADMFSDPLPRGFDIHLWSHVLHDWDEPEVVELLSKSYDSLPPGGRVAIHDAHVNEKKDGPLEVARFSVLLMHSTEGKCYSVAEINSMLSGLGFIAAEFIPTVAYRSLIVATKPSPRTVAG
jgi:SAM-dependent methyltransferase